MYLTLHFPTRFRLQSAGEFRSALQLMSILIIFVVIIVLAYFVTKWVAGYQKVKGASANIEILESYRVAPSKFIAIARVGNKYLAMTVGKDEMSFLCELSKDELIIRSPGEQKGTNFGALLGKTKTAQKGTNPLRDGEILKRDEEILKKDED